MLGNRLGWGISVVIVIIAGYLALLIFRAGEVSPPTGWVQKTVRPIAIPAAANEIVPGMNEGRDAGELYRAAIADYSSNAAAYEALAAATQLNPAAINGRPGLKALIDATRCSSMSLFARKPGEVANYEPEKPALEAIYRVGAAATRVALLSGVNDPATARKYYDAAFSLGLKLYQERIVFDELAKGEDLMGTAAAGMGSLAKRTKDTAKVTAIGAFTASRLSDFDSTIQPVWKVISSLDDNTIAYYAGDMFVLAGDKSVDLMWRVEATLQLGRLRYNAGRRGDQLAARRVLKQMAGDANDEPAVRAAAQAAEELTTEGYRGLR